MTWTCSNCHGPASRPCPACFTTLCQVCAKLEAHDVPTGKRAGQRCLGRTEHTSETDARLRLEAKLATKAATPWNLTGFVKVERRAQAA
jgi:hypothetical protein